MSNLKNECIAERIEYDSVYCHSNASYLLQLMRELGDESATETVHPCVQRRHAWMCSTSVPEVLAQLLAGDVISRKFPRQMSLADFVANFARVVLDDSLMSGFSAYSEERCYEKYMGRNSCPLERSISGLCRNDTGAISNSDTQ